MSYLRFSTVLIVLFAFVVLADTASQGQGDSKPDIRGVIINATIDKNAKDVLGTILVEGPKGQSYDKASIRITKDTKIFKKDGKDRKAATIGDLTVGTYVEAKFVGPVAESYPVQARAKEILILAERKK